MSKGKLTLYLFVFSSFFYAFTLGACGSKEACQKDLDCQQGQYCEPASKQCRQDCAKNGDCPQEHICEAQRGVCQKKKQECQKKSKKSCYGGHLVWFDSCGYPGKKASDCGENGCAEQQCKKSIKTCGDHRCDPSETCGVCPGDCPCDKSFICDLKTSTCIKGANCGNKICESQKGETCQTCNLDCSCKQGQVCQKGKCAQACGDGKCEKSQNEDCRSCQQDCGKCPASCGDSHCDSNESCKSCERDCGKCPAKCGDSHCDTGENCKSCEQDCGKCPASCGDSSCNNNENCTTCPLDCGCKSPLVCHANKCGQPCPNEWKDEWNCSSNNNSRRRCGSSNAYRKEEQKCQNQCGKGITGKPVCCMCVPGVKRCHTTKGWVEHCDCYRWARANANICMVGKGESCNSTTKTCTCDPNRSCSKLGIYRCNGTKRERCSKNGNCTFWIHAGCSDGKSCVGAGACK